MKICTYSPFIALSISVNFSHPEIRGSKDLNGGSFQCCRRHSWGFYFGEPKADRLAFGGGREIFTQKSKNFINVNTT